MPHAPVDRFHTIVVGAGSGGLTVAIGLARLGRRVALLEAAAVGGDCTNTGCIPSKTLIELARSVARHALAEHGRGAIVVDGAYRTTAPGVFAIGDLVGGQHSNVAHEHGRRLVRSFTLPLPLLPEGDHGRLTFTEPEVGQVGPTLAQLRRRWPDPLLAVQRIELADTDRGLTMGLRHGFLQLVALRFSGRLRAATVVAPFASEMLPLLTWAQRRGLSLWRLSRLEVPYPALTQAVRTAADAFLFASLPRLGAELATYLRWRWRRGPGG